MSKALLYNKSPEFPVFYHLPISVLTFLHHYLSVSFCFFLLSIFLSLSGSYTSTVATSHWSYYINKPYTWSTVSWDILHIWDKNLLCRSQQTGTFFRRWEYQTTLPASWEICMQVKKQQLELDVE